MNETLSIYHFTIPSRYQRFYIYVHIYICIYCIYNSIRLDTNVQIHIKNAEQTVKIMNYTFDH